MDTGPWDEAKLNEYDFYFQEIIFSQTQTKVWEPQEKKKNMSSA